MAGTKINAKTKTKDDKGKSNKSSSASNEESEDLDCTLLRKPIHTSITGFAQARKVFDLATEELQGLLTSECDILYECKVCRNIFRSLANFISHKRMYCKEKFDTSLHGHFVKTLSVASEMARIKKSEKLYNESLKEEELEILSQKENDRIPMTKDLTEIIERLSAIKGRRQPENPEVILQRIPKSNVAVFQNIKSNDDNITDLMRAQVKELNMLMSRENAILNSDGTAEVQSSISPRRAKEPESVIQISDDEDIEEGDILKCKICDLQFSTQKTLKFHMKYKHLESRLVYPCPDCLEIFSTSWSVYRHLFKVHRKTAAQIRRLRESIQAKAFRMNNPPAFYEKRKNAKNNAVQPKITEEERIDQENQAWMDNMEGDGEVPRCGGCGRSFERRAALAAHTHTCQPRSRALARRPDTRKIEIQIRKDYNKTTPPAILPLKTVETNDNKQIEAATRTKQQLEKEKPHEPTEEENSKENVQDKSTEKSLTKQTIDERNNEPENNKTKSNESKETSNLPFARQIEQNNFNAFIKLCESDIEIDKLQCKKCDTKLPKVLDLYEHMAEHYKWIRYACKLCNYKHYNFEKLPEHVKLVHKLKGDTDFYFSTVKAIDGAEALQLADCSKETSEPSETSPDSRRPSRCSSDSSRLSDDSSSSSTRIEGTRKRKIKHNKTAAKKKKESIVNEDSNGLKDGETSNEMFEDNETTTVVKIFEENSSDMDEVDEKSTKKLIEASATIISRRPVRKRTNKKNEDFEYDLSNLLKMEAQGYRDSQIVVNTKPIPTKKKSPVEIPNNIEINEKDYSGALATLSQKAVAISIAHMKCVSSIQPQSDARPSNIFLRPLLPKIGRVEKISPKKDTPIQVTTDSPNKAIKLDVDTNTNVNTNNSEKEVKSVPEKEVKSVPEKEVKSVLEKEVKSVPITPPEKPPIPEEDKNIPKQDVIEVNSPSEDQTKPTPEISEPIKTKLNVPPVLPLTVRRQSLEVIKNPLIKKNITEFSKAGMKTKILVIKPINRNMDGGKTINTAIKFQTIKLKDHNKSSSSSEEKSSDQVRVVKVPKVDCKFKLPITNSYIVKADKNLSTETPISVSPDCRGTTVEKSPEIICETSTQEEGPSNTPKTIPDVNVEEPSNTDLSNNKEPMLIDDSSSSLES
ncbi:uncharacterized protein [Epargyreus clarus]|uniref:uncharacterized protein n=1 Tax=Epargyreus clarus TaxID=520877 RepID=UPI003C2C8AE0